MTLCQPQPPPAHIGPTKLTPTRFPDRAADTGAQAAEKPGTGLWRLQRWGEYFAVVATPIFLPLEVRDLLAGITLTRAGALIINVAARAEHEPAAALGSARSVLTSSALPANTAIIAGPVTVTASPAFGSTDLSPAVPLRISVTHARISTLTVTNAAGNIVKGAFSADPEVVKQVEAIGS